MGHYDRPDRAGGSDDRKRRGRSRERSRSPPRRERDRGDRAEKDRARRSSRSRSPPRRRHRSRTRSRSRSPRRHKERHRESRSRSDERRRRRRRSRSSSSSSSSGGEGDDDDRKGKTARRDRHRKRSRSRDRKDRKRDKKEKRDKKKKKKTGVTGQWGEHGIISESDQYNKEAEFRTWLVEERKINPETMSKDLTKKEFARFMEDYNTSTLPHDKYYDMDKYERRMALMRHGETLPPSNDLYDVNADIAAHKSAHKRTLDPQESYLSKEQLQELRRVQNERIQAGKMKILGMDIKQSLGVRMDGSVFDG